MSRRVKVALNKLIDAYVHEGGHPKDLGTIIVDEMLHACVEGRFRLDKFARYTLLPMMREKPRRRQNRRRRR